MVFSEIGNLANEFLIEIPERYEYALMDVYIVMPNHIHTIITVNKNDDGRGNIPDGGCDDTPGGVRGDTHDGGPGDGGRGGCGRDAINRVSTVNPSNPTKRGGITGDKNPMLHDNISRVFNWYTGRVTYESRKINRNFAWQPRFYDHIIRNDQEYHRIKKYIINNPGNWNDDSLHPG